MAMEIDQDGVLDALPAMVWTALPDGNINYVSRSWLAYSGLSLREGPAGIWRATAEPGDLPQMLEKWRKILASGEPGDMEARLRRLDGQYRWFLIQCSPMRNEAGRIIKWCGVATDVDDLRRAEENLRRRALDFQLIVDSIPVPVAVTTPSGEVEGLNRPTLDYFGKTFEELKGWKASDVVHPDDLERTITAQTEAHQNGSTYNVESRHRRADGVYRWYNILGMPLRDSQGRILRWFHLLADIEDRKQAEEALRRSETQSRMILDNIATLVSLLGPDGSPELINRQIIDYTGRTEEDLKRWGGSDLVHPQDLPDATATFKKGIASGHPFDIVYRMRRFDGVYRCFEGHHRPLRNAEGDIVRWCVSVDDIDDRKRIEESLRASEKNLQIIIDTIPAMAWSARPDGAAEFFNQHFLDYVGLSLEQSQDWGWMVAVHPDDLNGLVATWQAVLSAGKLGEAEARLRRFDGEYRWFLFRASPLRDPSGNILKWYGTNIDIEDRKRADEALRANERDLNHIINTIPVLAWCNLPDGSNEFLNKPWHDYTGLPPEKANGWGWQVTIHPDDLPKLLDKWRHLLASGESGEIEARLRRFDGVYRWFLFRVNPLRDQSGTIVKWYGTNTDIDDLKRAEEALKRGEAFLAEGQYLARMGNLSWNVASGEIIWSEPLYRIFEFEPGTVVTLDQIASRVHPEDLPMMADMVERAQRGESDFEYRHRIVLPDDSIKHLHLIAHRSRNRPAETEYVGAVLDITQRRLSEEALEKVRSELAHVTRVMSLGAMTASIAHEVNQPLSGIITNASTCLRMLAADPPNIEVAQETARRTIRDGNRAADVIARLRALFSKRTPTIEPIDLNEAAREVIALSSGDLQRNRVVLRTELADGLPLVGGDRVQLQQVIMNLLHNASDAMSGVDDRPRRLLVRTGPDADDHVRLSVQDAGVGFGPEGAERLFEAFYTTKGDGMGIGLAVSRSIVDSHGGRLWAEANDGPGATFSFSIPEYFGEGTHDAGAMRATVTSNAQSSVGI